MKRKGKPKAKTKRAGFLRSGDSSSAANDCDVEKSARPLREDPKEKFKQPDEAECTTTASSKKTRDPPPIISISAASAECASSSAGVSSDLEPQADAVAAASSEQQLTSETSSQQQKQKQQAKPPDCIVVFDTASETTSQTLIKLQGGEGEHQKDSTPVTNNNNSDSDNNNNNLTSGISQVRKSYLELIKANNLHYFYLGSFIYSVILMLFLLVFIMQHYASSWLASHSKDNAFVRQHPVASEPAHKKSPTSTSLDCDSYDSTSLLLMKVDIRLAWLVLGLQLALTILQMACIAVKLYLDQSMLCELSMNRRATLATDLPDLSPKPKKTSSDRLTARLRELRAHHVEVAAVLLSLFQLLLAICLIQNYHCKRLVQAPPVILTSILVYIWPNLTWQLFSSETSTSTRKLKTVGAYLLVVLPLLLIFTIRLLNDHEGGHKLTLVLVALLSGLLRLQLLTRLHQVTTFKGADDLIEAKVSLEQQRQQQETLLLSVLPAYVAEQVKRNMLKKMDSLREDEFGAASELNTQSSSDFQQHQLLVSCAQSTSSQTAQGPVHCGRSLTLPNASSSSPASGPSEQSDHLVHEQDVVAACPLTSTGAQQRRRLRVSSSLASGVAYMREALMLNGDPNKRLAVKSHLVSTSTSSGCHNHSSSQTTTTAHEQQQVNAIAQKQVTPASNSIPAPPAPPPPPPPQIALPQQQSRRGFNELYIRTYNNVSLLYGDIVGFTRLCTQLSSSQLVRVLNNLFSYFDHLAEQHRIMRIKILGDCYYGVSGIPEFAVMGAKSSPRHHHKLHHHQPLSLAASGHQSQKSAHDNHAINCVNMGLNMIQYIKCLNVERASSSSSSSSSANCNNSKLHHQDSFVSTGLPANFELNMRIGIHTGHIHSGVIGLKKWQFDVWSNDVSVAMHCESSGVAGRVQVTEATCQHLHNAFTLELAARSTRDTYLSDKGICTYLIKERVRSPGTNNNESTSPNERQQANSLASTLQECNRSRKSIQSFAPSDNLMQYELHEDKIREATLGTIRQTLLAGEQLVGCRGADGLGACGLATLSHNDMHWLSFEFREATLERQFKSRLVATWHFLFSLLLLFLLLVVVLQVAVNGNLQDEAHHPPALAWIGGGVNLALASSLLVTGLLLLALLPKPRQKSAKLSGSTSSSSQRHSRSTSYHKPSSRSSSLQQQQQQPKTSSISILHSEAFQAHRHSSHSDLNVASDWAEGKFAISSFASNFLVGPIRSRINRLLQRNSVRKYLKRHASNPVSSAAVLLVFIVVLASQFYLMKQEFCLANLESDHLRRLHQASVLLVLISLDLSPSLLDHKLRSILILFLAALQLLALFVNNPNSRPDSESLYQRLVARQLASWVCGPPTNTRTEHQHQHQHHQHHPSVIYWCCDTLLLVLALWSLAYSRQIEFAQRCNFLWRNRLNVDHEELEYISGINKVLLENILPSHVVQHYLTQASGQLDGRACVQLVQEQQQNASQRRSNKSSTGTSSQQQQQQHQQQLMRMSVSCQMRNLQGMAPDELYHEQHESVAVMFASIPHFYEFYDESDISKQGLGCIALLNEIICDFDKLLLKNKFSRIEKIKTIGSTYMAAAGLRPCSSSMQHQTLSARNSTASQMSYQLTSSSTLSDATTTNHNHNHNNFGHDFPSSLGADLLQQQEERRLVLSQQKMNLICMIQFATSLMSALNGINKQSFQVFKLRVGVNTGPVIAGIIGAQRPFYDIWGDCVNIASRMESLGEVGRIQVEERTAKLLMECLCTETYSIKKRGAIDVKGKGGMVTYFVDKRQQQPPAAGTTQSAGSQESLAVNKHRQSEATTPTSTATARSDGAAQEHE